MLQAHSRISPTPATEAAFDPVVACWVCGERALDRYHRAVLDFHRYADEDPDLHAYTGHDVWLVRCRSCGFGQPSAMPLLPHFFDRMYAQRWSEEWIRSEFESDYKDFIFRSILRELARRARPGGRRLLDVGAHAGRFLHLARQSGWDAEGIELNPRTAAYAAARTGARVQHVNVEALADTGQRFDAVVMTDVLEHIPRPVPLLRTLAALTARGGTIAIKVPCGRSQDIKERVLGALTSRRPSLADNLVHVNHFTPASLRLALVRAGFIDVTVQSAAPELPSAPGLRRAADNAVRLMTYGVARLPGAVHTPVALHLQAFATREDPA